RPAVYGQPKPFLALCGVVTCGAQARAMPRREPLCRFIPSQWFVCGLSLGRSNSDRSLNGWLCEHSLIRNPKKIETHTWLLTYSNGAMSTTADLPIQLTLPPQSRKPSEKLEAATVRFCGDSGDGMQLAGLQLTNTSALVGNDVATFPDFPAEIRAP